MQRRTGTFVHPPPVVGRHSHTRSLPNERARGGVLVLGERRVSPALLERPRHGRTHLLHTHS